MSMILRKGMQHEFVSNWQRALSQQVASNGASYAGIVGAIDGDFGKRTHNATLSFKAEHGLPHNGDVDWDTWLRIGSEPSPPTQRGFDASKVPFVQARNFTRAGRTKVTLIVLHTMEAAEASTTAKRVADWFAGASAPRASAHYCVDDVSIIQCVKDEDVAWHAPGANRVGLGIEHAGYARQTPAEWGDPFSVRMLELSARLTASLCAKWGIPVEFCKAEQLRQGSAGITTHYEVSQAFKESDHWDPGPNFPMAQYLDLVRAARA